MCRASDQPDLQPLSNVDDHTEDAAQSLPLSDPGSARRWHSRLLRVGGLCRPLLVSRSRRMGAGSLSCGSGVTNEGPERPRAGTRGTQHPTPAGDDGGGWACVCEVGGGLLGDQAGFTLSLGQYPWPSGRALWANSPH